MGWRWSLLEALWAASAMFFIMLFFLPETSHDHILYQRARRLRRLTGAKCFKSRGGRDQSSLRFRQVIFEALISKSSGLYRRNQSLTYHRAHGDYDKGSGHDFYPNLHVNCVRRVLLVF
jgi:hypothetical protein